MSKRKLEELDLGDRRLGKYDLWHISDLKIYDKPLSLSELGVNRPPQSYMFVEDV